MPLAATLDGRVAVVIGASSGIGERTARALAEAGATVALLARRAELLDRVALAIEADGGRARVYPLDVTDSRAVGRTAARIRTELGPAGILIANAGVMVPTPATELHDARSRRQIDVNVSAWTETIGAFVEQLQEAAERDGLADLVSIAAIAAEAHPRAGFSVYEATKAYVIRLSSNLRAELGPQHVRVTTVVTDTVAADVARAEGALSANDLVGDDLTTDDIAEIIAFAVGLPRRVTLREIAVAPTRS